MTEINIRITADQKALQSARSGELGSLSPAELEAWVDENVTDLESARAVLKQLALMVLDIARTVRPLPKEDL